MSRITIAFLVLLIGVTLSEIKAASAQESPLTILSNEVQVDFPESVTFRLELEEDQMPATATLTYQLGQNNCLAAGTQVPVEVTGPTLEWTWVMSRSGNPPPGAEMWWQWHITDNAGNLLSTPREQLTFSDDRFDWRTEIASDDGSAPIRLNWDQGDQVGPVLLEAAVAGLERLEQDVGIKLQGEVQFFIYGDTADMREALLYVPDWSGGIAFSDYNTILIGVPPGLLQSYGRDTVRHELAHLVIGQFARSCLGGTLPNWLSEGLAVFAEGEASEDIIADINEGIRKDSFQPVRSLNGSFPSEGDQAREAYSQSFSLVAFLLENYGQEKMSALLETLAGAAAYDEALEEVYGFNADGLEVAWRQAIGAPPRQIPPTPTPLTAAAIPTTVPLGAAQSRPTPSPYSDVAVSTPVSSSSAGDSLEICGLGLAPLLVIGGLGIFPFARGRRRGPEERG
jgi:hypothetical protein